MFAYKLPLGHLISQRSQSLLMVSRSRDGEGEVCEMLHQYFRSGNNALTGQGLCRAWSGQRMDQNKSGKHSKWNRVLFECL